MMNKLSLSLSFLLMALSASYATNYTDVSVHDPSVMRVDDTYYIVGSHMAGAKTKDFMRWT